MSSSMSPNEQKPQLAALNLPGGSPDPLVRSTKLGFVGFQSSDVERLVAYYLDVLELELVARAGTTAYLAAEPNHHCVVIESGGSRGRTQLGLQIDGPLEDARERLAAAGLSCEQRHDPMPGVAGSLVVKEPGGTPIHLYPSQAQRAAPASVGLRPSKLGHMASVTEDLYSLQTFYQEVLGFRWSDSLVDIVAWLRCGPDHHSINFFVQPGPTDLHHIAFEMRDITHLKDMLDQLAKHDYRLEWGPGRHGPGHNIFSYHRDPDGNLIECFTEMDIIVDQQTGRLYPRPWHETEPQFPMVWAPSEAAANAWGPVSPMARV
jgi:catechol-2,3-dioxygenase